MNPSILMTLLLLSLLGGAISFPENGSQDRPSEDERKHNEIVPDDTSSSQEDSSEESVLSLAFIRLLMLMKMMKESFNTPSIIFLRIRFISFDDTNNGTQSEGGDFNRTSDDGMNVQNNTNDLDIKLNEENYKSSDESEEVNNKQSIETNTEAPPSTGKEKEGVEATDKTEINGHISQKTEEIEHKENNEKQTSEISATTPLQTEASTEHAEGEKQLAGGSTPSPQEPNYQENEIIPHEETKNNGENKSFLSKAVSAVSGFFGYLFG